MKALLLEKCEFSKESAAQLAKKKVWADFEAHEANSLSAFGINFAEWKKNEQRQYPRYVEHENFTSIVFFELEPVLEQRKRLHIYIGKDFLVTVGCAGLMGSFYENYIREKGMRKFSSEDAVFYILSSAAYRNSELIQKFEADTNRIENEALKKHGASTLPSIFSVKRKLVRYNKFFWRQRELIFELKNNQVAFFEPTRELKSKLDELFNSILFDINSIETLREAVMEEIIIKLDVPSELKDELEKSIREIVDKLLLEIEFSLANKILSKSKLTDEHIKEMVGELEDKIVKIYAYL